jgi:hypothetical protein
MHQTTTDSEQLSTLERFSAAFAYVLGAVPTLVNLDRYLGLVGTFVSKSVADNANVAVLVGIIGLWFGFQAMERGFVRAHIAQMCVVVFAAGVVGWLAPRPQLLGTGLIPVLAAVAVYLGLLVLAALAWAGRPPSLPLVGRLSRRWGRYDRRANT